MRPIVCGELDRLTTFIIYYIAFTSDFGVHQFGDAPSSRVKYFFFMSLTHLIRDNAIMHNICRG